jgi:hypothetical protein
MSDLISQLKAAIDAKDDEAIRRILKQVYGPRREEREPRDFKKAQSGEAS